MLDSSGALGGFFVLMAILAVFFNPVIAVVLVVVALGPLTLFGVSRLWKHAAPAAARQDAPPVPSTRQASYDPRWES